MLLIGIAMLAAQEGGIMVFSIIAISFAVILLWGSPEVVVVVNTAGRDLDAARVCLGNGDRPASLSHEV